MQGLKTRRAPPGDKGQPVLLCYDYFRAATACQRGYCMFVAGTTKEPKPHTPPSGGDLQALTPAQGAVASTLCICIT
jgi:hypothetical protein